MKARGKIRSAYFAGAASWSMQPPIFCCNSSPSCVSYMQKKKRFTVLGGWYLRISSPIFIARKYITLTLRLYSCIMYIQAKPMRFYRARVFGQAPKFLPKIQALCLCRAPFAFPPPFCQGQQKGPNKKSNLHFMHIATCRNSKVSHKKITIFAESRKWCKRGYQKQRSNRIMGKNSKK